MQHRACVVAGTVLCVHGFSWLKCLVHLFNVCADQHKLWKHSKQTSGDAGWKTKLASVGQFAGQSPGAHWPGWDPALWEGGSLQAREEASTALGHCGSTSWVPWGSIAGQGGREASQQGKGAGKGGGLQERQAAPTSLLQNHFHLFFAGLIDPPWAARKRSRKPSQN